MPGDSDVIRFMVILTTAIVFATAALISYSIEGYTFTKYPKVPGEAVICIEGEVNPTNQSITVINDGQTPTVNPAVVVNDETFHFNMTIADKGARRRIDTLKLGCNRIRYYADSDTQFKVKTEYLSHWRPVVKYLEIGNLQVGHTVRYFIYTEDADSRPIVKSIINITDITKNVRQGPVFDAEFEGPAVRYRMEQPGNYKADMQVFDGYVWSDVWEAGFTAHVITTEEQKKTYRLYMLADDPVVENDGYIPIALKPDDNGGMKMAKRAVNGAYTLVKRGSDYLRSLLTS